MNSRLKFRAWDNKYKYMNYKVLIGNIEEGAGENWTAHAVWVDPTNVDYKCDPHWNNIDQHGVVEFMQCTRLKDKNRKEIWEGDIIEWSLGGDYGVSRMVMQMMGQSWTPHINLESKVIGNIYEHPELLEHKKKSFTVVGLPLCQQCKFHLDSEPHNCPYESYINNDDNYLCNCCDDCVKKCIRNI